MDNVKIKDIDSNSRPREKIIFEGIESLTNEELLAVLIDTGNKEVSAIGLASRILRKSGGIKGLADMDLKSLQEINGIGPAKSARIFAAMELSKRISKILSKQKFDVNSPSSIANLFMEELRYKKKEVVKVLLLDTKNNIISDLLVSEGSLNASIVHPREVYVEAVKRSANKIIVVHNHPSGDPSPSNEDIKITKRLYDSGEILGIELLDHVIIGDGNYCSLRELNYI